VKFQQVKTMEPTYKFPIMKIMSILVIIAYPVTNGELVENQEAIEHFEKVFKTAAVFAGAKVEEIKTIKESNRRWDSGSTSNEYQRDARQTEVNDRFRFDRNPVEERTIFRKDNANLRINVRGNGRQQSRSQNRFRENQNTERYFSGDNEQRIPSFGQNIGNYNYRRNRFNTGPQRNVNGNNQASFESNTRQNNQESLIPKNLRDFSRSHPESFQSGNRETQENNVRPSTVDTTQNQGQNPRQRQQFSYNQFQSDGTYFQLSLIQNSTESKDPGNSQSTFYSFQQASKPTGNRGESDNMLDARLNPDIMDEIKINLNGNSGINIDSMDSLDKLAMENVILKNMENLNNGEKSLMEDIIEMVKENMGPKEFNVMENVIDKNMEYMNSQEKNLMENLLTVAIEMMQDREIMIMENILDKGIKNMNIKEKVLMEDVIDENIETMTNMEIGLMNNILHKDLENMNIQEKLLMEDILRMEIMKNINERMPMEENPTIKMVSMKIKDATPLTINSENPVDTSQKNKNLDNVLSGKILYCQYCILPANSGGFIIN